MQDQFFKALTRRQFQAGLCATAAVLLAARPVQAADFPANERFCATCNYWTGARTVSADRQSVTVADGVRGTCTNPRSPRYNQQTRPDQLFPNGWERWRELG